MFMLSEKSRCFFTKRFCYAASFGIGGKIGVERWRSAKLTLLHGGSYHLGYMRETDFSLTEGEICHLVGRIQDARHRSALLYGLIGKSQTAEFFLVGRAEVQAAEAKQVQALVSER